MAAKNADAEDAEDPVPAPAPAPPPHVYTAGAVRQNMQTLATATRVNDNLPEEWLMATLDRGGRFVPFNQVSGPDWVDLGPASS